MIGSITRSPTSNTSWISTNWLVEAIMIYPNTQSSPGLWRSQKIPNFLIFLQSVLEVALLRLTSVISQKTCNFWDQQNGKLNSKESMRIMKVSSELMTGSTVAPIIVTLVLCCTTSRDYSLYWKLMWYCKANLWTIQTGFSNLSNFLTNTH